MVYTSTVFYQNLAKLECSQKFMDLPSPLVRKALIIFINYPFITLPLFYNDEVIIITFCDLVL